MVGLVTDREIGTNSRTSSSWALGRSMFALEAGLLTSALTA